MRVEEQQETHVSWYGRIIIKKSVILRAFLTPLRPVGLFPFFGAPPCVHLWQRCRPMQPASLADADIPARPVRAY
jgi:hypothetical protein